MTDFLGAARLTSKLSSIANRATSFVGGIPTSVASIMSVGDGGFPLPGIAGPVGGITGGAAGGSTGGFASSGGGGGSKGSGISFEQVYASLTPFQWPDSILSGGTESHPLEAVFATGGVIFPYNPSISEGISVKYDNIELTHSNESYYAYRGTDNVRINISDAVWTCDTFQNAVYALSVLHFFRSYSLMDFGRLKSGRPPSPMWFSAYGNYAFNRVPVLMEKADWSFPNDVDFIGVPEFGTPEYQSGTIATQRNAQGSWTWLPITFKISSISLIVQHAPSYWTNFNLDDYYSGKMLERDGNFHTIGPAADVNGAVGPGAARSAIAARDLPSSI